MSFTGQYEWSLSYCKLYVFHRSVWILYNYGITAHFSNSIVRPVEQNETTTNLWEDDLRETWDFPQLIFKDLICLYYGDRVWDMLCNRGFRKSRPNHSVWNLTQTRWSAIFLGSLKSYGKWAISQLHWPINHKLNNYMRNLPPWITYLGM